MSTKLLTIITVVIIHVTGQPDITTTVSKGVNSLGFKVVYGDEDLSILNEVVQQEEKKNSKKVKLNEAINPLPPQDVKCLMSVDRYCSKEMGELKSVLIQAVKEDCEKCSVEDKERAGRLIASLMAHDPVAWKLFLTRYMPEPNLPPLRVNLTTKDDHNDILSVLLIQDKLPVLPEESRKQLIQEFQLRPETAIQLVNEPILLEYFQKLITDNKRSANKVANLLINDLLTVLNKRKLDVDDCPITVKQLKELTDMHLSKDITLDVCRKVLDELIALSDSDISPLKVVQEKGWILTGNEDDIKKLCVEVLENNPKLVKQYKEGKIKVFKALLGILFKNSQNKVDMAVASRIMEGLLKNDK